MIYTSFIYLLIAIALFSGASLGDNVLFPLQGDVLLIVFLYLFFIQLVRIQLRWIRVTRQDSLGANLAAFPARQKLFGRFRLLSLLFFAVSVYVFDLKALLAFIPGVLQLEVLQNLLGIGCFLLYWCILWYWEFSEGDAPAEMESAYDYIKGQLSFQFGVFVPWLALNLILDILLILPIPGLSAWVGSPLFQLLLFALFFLLLAVFSPLIMVYFWRCRPLQDEGLQSDINALCQAHGVRFKGVLSWNALGGGLVTAGVIGLFSRFRFLLITPRLRQLLSREEMLAVVAHEIAHVKRRHLLHYFVFILGFVLISMGSIDRLILLFFNTAWGQAMMFSARGELRGDVISFTYVFLSLYFLIFYFRFIFGYFMRNFERQADLYPLTKGMAPGPLLSAFEKLSNISGDDGSRKNWHHYNLPERMAMVEMAALDPQQIKKHDRSLRRSLLIYWLIMILLAGFLYSPFANRLSLARDMQLYALILEKQVALDPQNIGAQVALATIYYELKRWHDAENLYKKVLTADPSQSSALNNLSWLYLTCEDESLRDPLRALPLAQAAAERDYSATTLDTLAEAYYQNEQYVEAYRVAKEAFRLAEDGGDEHFARQLRKMEEALEKNQLLYEAERSNKRL